MYITVYMSHKNITLYKYIVFSQYYTIVRIHNCIPLSLKVIIDPLGSMMKYPKIVYFLPFISMLGNYMKSCYIELSHLSVMVVVIG